MFSIKTANKILNTYVKPKYMGLLYSAPTDDGTAVTFSELVGTGYARANLSISLPDATNRTIINNEIIYFPEAESDWGTATHFAIFDDKTGGEPIIYGELDSAVTISTNYVPLFRKERFRFTLS